MIQKNKYFLKTILMLALIGLSINGFTQSKTSYHVQNGVEINKSECADLNHLIIILPYTQTNQYQTVSNINDYSGELLDIPETDDKYLRYTLLQSDIQNFEDVFEIYYEFDITLNTVNFDFNQITEIYPYNTSSDIYIWYTGQSGEYVVPNNATIQSIGDDLWSQSLDILDYANKCYEYVAANFDYINPITGLHTLAEILSSGGGDCGNLSSIYVSLLRYKDIPARHIVTIRPDGSYHVWADFYLENYGWIPVDVTYKQSNPTGNYFGIYDGNGIVVTKEVWLYLERDESYSYYASLLQNYHWWYWYGVDGCNALISKHVVFSKEPDFINEVNNSNKLLVYPNPADEIIKISSAISLDNSLIEVYTIHGRLINKTSLNDKYEIDIGNLSNGVYIVKIRSETINFVEKIIKK